MKWGVEISSSVIDFSLFTFHSVLPLIAIFSKGVISVSYVTIVTDQSHS